MSSKQIEDLKKRTLLLEKRLQTLQTTLDYVKKQAKTSSKEENSTEQTLMTRCGYVFLDNNLTISQQNNTFKFLSYNGTLHPTIVSKQGIDWLHEQFEPNERDIIVQTYPKLSKQSGTTFLCQILYQILTKAGLQVLGAQPQLFPDTTKSVMWLEYKSSQEFQEFGNNNKLLDILNNNSQNTIRLWKTHSNLKSFPCKNGKYSGKCKIIHITRNPKDVIRSGYAFFKRGKLFSGDFDSYFDVFINGLVRYNDLFKFEMDTIEMIKKYGKNKILFLYYEDLILNPINEIKKIVEFLNIKNVKQKEIKEIIEFTSFNNQLKLQNKIQNKIAINCLDKGKIGTWKSVFNKKQSDIIDKIIKTRIEPFNKELSNDMKIKWNFG